MYAVRKKNGGNWHGTFQKRSQVRNYRTEPICLPPFEKGICKAAVVLATHAYPSTSANGLDLGESFMTCEYSAGLCCTKFPASGYIQKAD